MRVKKERCWEERRSGDGEVEEVCCVRAVDIRDSVSNCDTIVAVSTPSVGDEIHGIVSTFGRLG